MTGGRTAGRARRALCWLSCLVAWAMACGGRTGLEGATGGASGVANGWGVGGSSGSGAVASNGSLGGNATRSAGGQGGAAAWRTGGGGRLLGGMSGLGGTPSTAGSMNGSGGAVAGGTVGLGGAFTAGTVGAGAAGASVVEWRPVGPATSFGACPQMASPPPGSNYRNPPFEFDALPMHGELGVVRESGLGIFVASGAGLDILKRSAAGTSLVRISRIPVARLQLGFELDGSRLWLVADDEIRLFDVGVPAAPVEIASTTAGDGAFRKGRLRAGRLELEWQHQTSVALAVVELDAAGTLVTRTGPEGAQLWFTDERSWLVESGGGAVAPCNVMADATVELGEPIPLELPVVAGIDERSGAVRLVTTPVAGEVVRASLLSIPTRGPPTLRGWVEGPGYGAVGAPTVMFDDFYAAAYVPGVPLGVLFVDFDNPDEPQIHGPLEFDSPPVHLAGLGSSMLVFTAQKTRDEVGPIEAYLVDTSSVSMGFVLDRRVFGAAVGRIALPYGHTSQLSAAYLSAEGMGVVSYFGGAVESECQRGGALQLFRVSEDEIETLGEMANDAVAGQVWMSESELAVLSADAVRLVQIERPDAPSMGAWARLERPVSQTLAMNEDTVVRLGADPWTKAPFLDVTTLQQVDAPESLHSTDLSIPHDVQDNRACLVVLGVRAAGELAHISVGFPQWIERPAATAADSLYVIHVDQTDPRLSSPWAILEGAGVPLAAVPASASTPAAVVTFTSQRRYEYIDIHESGVAKRQSLPLPAAAIGEAPPVFIEPGLVTTTRIEPSADGLSEAYWLERVDVSAAEGLMRRSPLSVSGVVLSCDHEAALAVVAVPRLEAAPLAGGDSCADSAVGSGAGCFDEGSGECRALRTFVEHLALDREPVEAVDSIMLDPWRRVGRSWTFGSRLVLVTPRAIDDQSVRLEVIDKIGSSLSKYSGAVLSAGTFGHAATADYVAGLGVYCDPSIVGLQGEPTPRWLAGEVGSSWVRGRCPSHVAIAGDNLVLSYGSVGACARPLRLGD